MKRYLILLGLGIWGLTLAGCALMGGGQPDPQLAAQYVRSAQDLEKQGDLPAALEQYKLALTADPANAVAGERADQLSAKLAKMADERYQLGMKYYSQGKYGLARKEFLTALKYQPDHPLASKMLVSKEPEKSPGYVFHVVKPGESLSMIAKEYYGDYKKYGTIARFNHIEDATVVKPGQRIMIPVLAGMAPDQRSASAVAPGTPYVEHVLRPGQSISRLAQLYYGDYKQFHIIAKFNGMDDATQVKAGQVIKVPKVAGLPFHDVSRADQSPDTGQPAPDVEKPAEAGMPAVAPEPAATALQNDSGTGDHETDEQILAYRDSGIELFKEGKYEDAVFELNKAVEAMPKDAQTRDYLSQAYFESGKQLFAQHDYKAAQEAFESARQYDPGCAQCQAYIDKSKIGPLLIHRSNGLAYFDKNEFKSAIDEFEKFLAYQPEDKEVRTYLSKAYFQQAVEAYNQGDYLAAKKGFESAAANDSNCEQCADYVKKSLDSYKEAHYNKGIVYFGKEQLPEAISEWEMVYDIDPGYKEVGHNLEQSRRLLEKLERIKKSRQ